MKLSLVISTYESPAALEKVLQGVLLQSERPHEIFIADDGSGPATRELIENWQPRLRMKHVWQEHQGFRKTIIMNRTIAAASGDYVVLLDGDCVPQKGFIHDHAALAEKNFWVQGRRCFVEEAWVPEFSAGRTSLLNWSLRGRIKGLAKAVRLPFPVIRRNREQRGIIGCNLGLWRDDLLAVNGFDEDFTGWGMEDSDLGTRLYHLGRRRKFVYGRAIVYHLNHPKPPTNKVADNRERLARTISSGNFRCQHGMSQYLPPQNRPPFE